MKVGRQDGRGVLEVRRGKEGEKESRKEGNKVVR